ncbi:hypothetical protein NPIL_698931 [Nephila pilipes]|uniref:Uncharacterized protein n=1 Tax=Nephila pilipes TaxID=299642 RepID=A0A8X6N4Q5_NEPPI|nr:hypothetical protein NPIL_698931 [Nephila pilipes]
MHSPRERLSSEPETFKAHPKARLKPFEMASPGEPRSIRAFSISFVHMHLIEFTMKLLMQDKMIMFELMQQRIACNGWRHELGLCCFGPMLFQDLLFSGIWMRQRDRDPALRLLAWRGRLRGQQPGRFSFLSISQPIFFLLIRNKKVRKWKARKEINYTKRHLALPR